MENSLIFVLLEDSEAKIIKPQLPFAEHVHRLALNVVVTRNSPHFSWGNIFALTVVLDQLQFIKLN